MSLIPNLKSKENPTPLFLSKPNKKTAAGIKQVKAILAQVLKPELETFLMTDQPPTCPKCGARVAIIERPESDGKPIPADADVYVCADCGKGFTDGNARDDHFMSPACPGKTSGAQTCECLKCGFKFLLEADDDEDEDDDLEN